MTLLVVDLRPGVAALTGVVSVLHARAADVDDVTYTLNAGRACLHLRLAASVDDGERLAAQIGRRVDVVGVRVENRARASPCASHPDN